MSATITVGATDAVGAVATGQTTAIQQAGVTIPMSWNDPRFSGNTAGSGFGPNQGPTGTVSNLDWNENPGYASGDQCWAWNGGDLTMNQCRVDWREGPRLAGDTGTFHVDQSYINCVGKGTDHADAFQAYIQGGGTFLVTNSHIRAYTDAEAAAKYGSGFIGSTCLFWADGSRGLIKFQNVLCHGGTRMVSVYADAGAIIHVNFDHVYFVQEPGYPATWTTDIRIGSGGTIIIDNWTNVFNATIVNGVIVPGAAIPHP